MVFTALYSLTTCPCSYSTSWILWGTQRYMNCLLEVAQPLQVMAYYLNHSPPKCISCIWLTFRHNNTKWYHLNPTPRSALDWLSLQVVNFSQTLLCRVFDWLSEYTISVIGRYSLKYITTCNIIHWAPHSICVSGERVWLSYTRNTVMPPSGIGSPWHLN